MVEGKRDDGVRETKMLSAWSTGRMVFSTQLAAATEQKSNAMIWRYNAGAHLMIRTSTSKQMGAREQTRCRSNLFHSLNITWHILYYADHIPWKVTEARG